MLEQLYTLASGHVAVLWDRARERVGAHVAAGRRLASRLRTPPRQAPPLYEPPRLRPQESWQRATVAITAALAGFERVQVCQAEAASRVDAADYALQRLLGELSAVMPIAADGSELRAFLASIGEPVTAADDDAVLAA